MANKSNPPTLQLLTGTYKTAADVAGSPLGRLFPRFQGEAFDHNIQLTRKVEEFAEQKGCTAAQVSLAWVRKQSQGAVLPGVLPIPGSTSTERVKQNAAAVTLTDAEFATLSEMADSFETAGARYPSRFPVNT